MTASQHYRVDAPRAFRLNDQVPSRGIAAAMGKKTPGHGKPAARHGDGALMEVDAEREIDGIFEDTEGLHVIGQSNVSKSGSMFASRDRLVDCDRRIVCEKLHE